MEFKNSIFFGRDILIATCHKKEEAIGHVMQAKFHANIIVPKDFNTDRFGTFSGEIQREGSAMDAARLKCKAAATSYNVNLVIASEGSFGPHPSLFFGPADEEILLLADYENDLEIAVREISVRTNFSGKKVSSCDDARDFAQSIGFPSHKVILKKSPEDMSHVVKDIAGWDELSIASDVFLKTYSSLFVETDMRAMNNPTRMSVIAAAATKLAQLMDSTCPICQTPGFDVGEVTQGLPCSLCSLPTKSTLKHIYICKKCDFQKEIVYPHNKTHEEPLFCDWCNP